MVTEQDQDLILRFSMVMHDVPHQSHCARREKRHDAHYDKCSCAMGEQSLKIFNEFIELIAMNKV